MTYPCVLLLVSTWASPHSDTTMLFYPPPDDFDGSHLFGNAADFLCRIEFPPGLILTDHLK